MTGQRRLTARSVIASTLLGVSPPELPTRSLVATAELLGVAAGTARVAMSRMVAAGELEATDTGYRLVGRPLLARRSRQELSRTGSTEPWSGEWHLAVVGGEARPAAERAELRAALGALRHGELREGVWLRPRNLPAGVLAEAEALVAARCTTFASRPEDPVELAASLWDLAGWSAEARTLIDQLDQLTPRLVEGDHTALGPGFVVAATVLRHLQADPLLPAELVALVDPAWPGAALRARYATVDRAFKDTLAAWIRAQPA